MICSLAQCCRRSFRTNLQSRIAHVETYDVVVTGLGPVGACLANILGTMGFSALVVEQTDGLEMRPRAAAMLNIFKELFVHLWN